MGAFDEKYFPELPEEIYNSIIKNSRGIYYVGGFVRDFLLNINHIDRDVLVCGIELPKLSDILKKFGRADIVGKSFNVIKFSNKSIKYDFVVTSNRTQSGCFPDSSLSLEEDLVQRDFTINSIAWDLSQKTIIDPLSGLKDIKNKILRANSINAYINDPLRIIRLCRFSAKLSFKIEQSTKKIATNSLEDLSNIAMERIGDEFKKFMLLKNPSIVFECLLEIGALKVLLPELYECVGVSQPGGMHAYDVFQHTLKTIDESPEDLLIRFGALFHDISKPSHKILGENGRARFYNHQKTAGEIALKWLKDHSFSYKFAEDVATLVEFHMFSHAETEKGIRRFIRNLGEDLLYPLFELRLADTKAQGLGGDIDEEIQYRNRVMKVLLSKPPLAVQDLQLNGYDVIRILDIIPGKTVGDVLNYLLEKVIDDPKLNKREILREIAKEKYGRT